MLGRMTFATLGQRIALGMNDANSSSLPMAGLPTVLTGDLFQLPAVRDGPLFADPVPSARKPVSEQQLAGRVLFKQFSDVLFFDEAKRTKEKALERILDHLRFGTVDLEDYKLLSSRVLSACKPKPSPQFLEDMVIITPRNGLRTLLNYKFAEQLAKARGLPFVLLEARDSPTADKTMDEKLQRSLLRLGEDDTAWLPGRLPLVPGMRYLVKDNLFPELGVANGAIGTLVGLVLHPDDAKCVATAAGGETVVLNHFPEAALLELDSVPPGVSLPALPHCPPNVIAIPIVKKSFETRVVHQNGNSRWLFVFCCTAGFTVFVLICPGVEQKCTFNRRQLPLCPAKALTVHAAQGKTLRAVCVDLPLPRGEQHAAAKLYVAISRVEKLEQLVFLRPFDLADIQHQPPAELFDEINRLRQLERSTLEKVNVLRRLASG